MSRAASQSGRGEGAGAVPVLVLVLVLVPVPVPVLVLVGASPCRPSSACFAARGLQRHARGWLYAGNHVEPEEEIRNCADLFQISWY